ncbi:MAG: hypothetical protein EXS05_10160 [Planctomycetaceae bacterium]|nr:hypothetical protein [Planctomycetaceae bacterium]
MHRIHNHGWNFLKGAALAAWLVTQPALADDEPLPGNNSSPAVEPAADAPDRPEAPDDDPPAGEAVLEIDDKLELPAMPVAPMIQRFGGRWGVMRRNMFNMAGVAAATNDEGGEAPRSVVLPDNGDMRRRLEKIRAEITDGHFADAARQLGQLLQNPETRDFFLSRDEERQGGRSFQAEIRQMIGALPPEGLSAYNLQYDALAKQRLAEALAGGSEAALREVAQRFPYTPAGAEALYRLGHSLWEHGRPEAAAACFERLRAERVAAAPFEPRLSLALAVCRYRCGQTDKFRAIVNQLRAAPDLSNLSLAGAPLAELLRHDDAAERLAALLGPVPESTRAGDWTVYRGNPARNRRVAAAEPLLAPRWTQAVSANPETQLAIDRAVESYRGRRGTFLPGLAPLAVGDLVLMRTARGVAAFDLLTGDRLWNHPADDDADNAGVDRLLWSAPAGGAFSADRECFYLIDASSPADRDSAGRSSNVLTAREHYQSRQGRLRWQVGGGSGGGEPALAQVLFLGSPLPYQGRLYVEFEKKGAIWLGALDPATGRLEWSQELALVEESQGTDPLRRLAGATPSISADEIVVCPTAGGAVVAVDLTSQSLLWAYRYARRPMTQVNPEGDDLPRLDQHERWLDGTVAIGEGCVILSPAESGELHCLDLYDGHPRWTQPRGDGLFVGPVTDRAVVVVGKSQVRAMRPADGQPAWEAPVVLPASAFVFGRGIATDDLYYLPMTSGGIVSIDLKQGAIVGQLPSLRQTAPGNLIWHRGLFISQSPVFLEAFDERGSAEREIAAALARNPRDAASLLRRGELDLYAGRIDEALSTIRQARALAPTGRSRALLTSALLDAVRREGADRETLMNELDGLARP